MALFTGQHCDTVGTIVDAEPGSYVECFVCVPFPGELVDRPWIQPSMARDARAHQSANNPYKSEPPC